jgi:hypothetical protein
MNRAAILLALAFCSSLPAFAADDAAPLRTQNAAIVEATAGASGVFKVQDDGTVRHVQSGLVCPAKYPNSDFYHVFVYKADGTDVGCDYRRADDKGGAWSKLTIFVVKAADGTTSDQAFARYHAELAQTYPGARPLGEAIQGDPNDHVSPLASVRSAEYLIAMNGQAYTTQLYVTVAHGWIIEIRTTFVGLPNTVDAAREGPHGAEMEMGDRLMGPKALIDALGTLGQ